MGHFQCAAESFVDATGHTQLSQHPGLWLCLGLRMCLLPRVAVEALPPCCSLFCVVGAIAGGIGSWDVAAGCCVNGTGCVLLRHRVGVPAWGDRHNMAVVAPLLQDQIASTTLWHGIKLCQCCHGTTSVHASCQFYSRTVTNHTSAHVLSVLGRLGGHLHLSAAHISPVALQCTTSCTPHNIKQGQQHAAVLGAA